MNLRPERMTKDLENYPIEEQEGRENIVSPENLHPDSLPYFHPVIDTFRQIGEYGLALSDKERDHVDQLYERSVTKILKTRLDLEHLIKEFGHEYQYFLAKLDHARSLPKMSLKYKVAMLLGEAALLAGCLGGAPTTEADTSPTQPIATEVDSSGPSRPVQDTAASPSATPEATPTVDVESLPMDEVARLLAEGSIDYPSEFSDEMRAELSKEIAELMNNEVAGQNAYVEMNFNNVGDVRIAWNPETQRWQSDHNTPEELLDFEGNSLPPLFIPGYTNSEGREVFINPETGVETIVPSISFPGIEGEVSLTDLYLMGQQELEELARNLMLGAENMELDAHATEYVSENLNHLFIPVMLYENSTNNDRIYQNIFRVTTEYSQVPEANTSFVDQATNSVIMPIIDGETRQVLFWINIQQGMQWGKTRSYVFNQEGATYNYPSTRSTLESTSEDRQNWLYGAAEGHSFGILVPGKETSTTYDIIGDEPLLEGGVGIGSEEEIGEILSSDGSLTDLIKIIKNLNIRMIVLYPFYEIHESSVD